MVSRDIGTTVRDRHNLISMWLSQNTSRKVKEFSEDERFSFRGLLVSICCEKFSINVSCGGKTT